MKLKKTLFKLLCVATCAATAIVPMTALTACGTGAGNNNGGGTIPTVKDLEFDEYGNPIFIDEDGKGITLNVLSVIGAPDKAYLSLVNNAFNDTNRANGIQANIDSADTFLFYSQIVNTINTDPKNAPDVIIMHSERLTYHVDQNVIVPISDLYDLLGENNTFSADNYIENVAAECYAKGKNDKQAQLYGVPLDVHSGVWYVRQDILTKNGLQMPTNKAEFESVCASLMAKKEEGTLWVRDMTSIRSQIDNLSNPFDSAGDAIRESAWKQVGKDSDFYPVEMSGADNIESGWIPQSAVLQNGGKLCNADGTPAWKDSTGLRSTLEMIDGWRGKYIGPNRSNDTLQKNLGNGNAVFACEGPWWAESFLNQYDKYLGQGSLGILSMSKLYADDVTSADANKIYGVGHAVCITNSRANASQKRRLAAALYAQYITENSVKYTAGGHIPACKSVLESEEYLNSTAYNRYIKYMGKPEDYVMLGNTQYFKPVYEELKRAYTYTLSSNVAGTVLDKINRAYKNAMDEISSVDDL